MDKRVFIEQKELYQTTAQNLLDDLNETLALKTLTNLKIVNVYDIFNIQEKDLKKIKDTFLVEHSSDEILDDYEISSLNCLGVEPVLGQFDQRAELLKKALLLLDVSEDVEITTSLMYIFNNDLNKIEKEKIINYLINPLENQIKDYNVIDLNQDKSVKPVLVIDNFISLNQVELEKLLNELSLAMNYEDLKYIQDYFIKIKRNPTISEVLALDTYWSDHCRHTTFETHLSSIDFSRSNIKDEIEDALNIYKNLRKELKRENKPMTLMDMASIQAKYQKSNGTLDDLEESNEVNACSIEVDVDVDGKNEKYLLMYKNETHNHPTEIEPFGGASTCVGGAIRDPLSGRAYVYQAMRITGAGDISEDVSKTRENKLSQKFIAQKAAIGNSSYGNQIGSPTTYLKEFYHPGFVAKRMELGAVVGAVKKDAVTRAEPKPGDYIIMLGAPTGRDGVGAATGSSKVQSKNALKEAGSEVQKGNAPEERKIQRLFRNPQLTKLIKKGNDLGAGGVSVAIGELADGVKVDLNAITTKYAGLNGNDLALSESQERMVVVIDAADFSKFNELAQQENVEAFKVAEVTSDDKLTMIWNEQKVIELDREFLSTNGISQEIAPIILSSDESMPFDNKELIVNNNFKDSLNSLVTNLNYLSQTAVTSMFDNSVGRSTVLANYGGKYQVTLSEASIQKIPVLDGMTNTASILAHGYNPLIGLYEPFYAGSYAIVESVARIIACGGTLTKIRLSLQEYFERVSNQPEKFGKPVAALLGALKAQHQLNLPALGGKDSMSGSFEDIDVPPTIVSFAISTIKTDRIISQEIKSSGEYVYVLIPEKKIKINYEKLISNFNFINELQEKELVSACSSIKDGGIINELLNMSYGNNIGIKLNDHLKLEDLFYSYYGGFIVVSKNMIDDDRLILIGETQENCFTYQKDCVEIKELLTKSQEVLSKVYPTVYTHKEQLSKNISYQALKLDVKDVQIRKEFTGQAIAKPIVYIPVFMGSTSENDIEKAFINTGAETIVEPFVDLNQQFINKSIDRIVSNLDKSNIFVLSGGYSASDEWVNINKYMLNILLNSKVKDAINNFLAREGLILGIDNGFKLLLQTGLLPYNKLSRNTNKVTLSLNDNGKHVSKFVKTKILKSNSLWTNDLMENQIYQQILSSGEAKLIADREELEKLFNNNQVISQYVDDNGIATMDYRYNPAGSYASIEGLISLDGQIMGKVVHSERYEDGLFQNIYGEKDLKIFENAVNYFRKK